MDINNLELVAVEAASAAQVQGDKVSSELFELQLAYSGGGLGDTVAF